MSTDKPISIGMYNPLVESDTLMCPHGGKVVLKSKKGKSLQSGNDSLILQSDLIGSSISGCTFNIAGVPQPCTCVAMIPPSALSIKDFNDDKAVIQQFCNMIYTDKFFPLVCVPKPNQWNVSATVPVGNNMDGKLKKSEFKPQDFIFHIRYSLNNDDRHSLIGLQYAKVTNSVYGASNADEYEIEICKYNEKKPFTVNYKDYKESDKNINDDIKNILVQEYPEKNGYVYKALTLEISNTIFEYIFIGLKKSKIYGSFGYVEEPDMYIRNSNNNDYLKNKPIVTKFIKTGMKLDKIDIVIN